MKDKIAVKERKQEREFEVSLNGKNIGSVKKSKYQGSGEEITYYQPYVNVDNQRREQIDLYFINRGMSDCPYEKKLQKLNTIFAAKMFLYKYYKEHHKKEEEVIEEKTFLDTESFKRQNPTYYPTPTWLVGKMWGKVFPLVSRRERANMKELYGRSDISVLEPSSGSGAIIDGIKKASPSISSFDMIEADPILSAYLKDKYVDGDCKLVGDDFLRYSTYKKYDAIVMNPPFDKGDLHLLKAISLAERQGSVVICLLNAETIRNPYSNSRKELLQKLKKHGANVEFISKAFQKAKRKTNVDIALVSMKVPPKEKVFQSNIWETMEKVVMEEEVLSNTKDELTLGNPLERLVQQFNVEVRATLELVRQYEALKPHMSFDLPTEEDNTESSYRCTNPIVKLKWEGINQYLLSVRYKYWKYILNNSEFVGNLTTNLREQYAQEVDRMKNYDFNLFNIKQVIADMNVAMKDGLEKTIEELFKKLTVTHSFNECSQNIHYYNGWKTNKAHKVNDKKVIIPFYNGFDWKGRVDSYCCKPFIKDLQKSLEYLDNSSSSPSQKANDIDIDNKLALNVSKNIEFRYFFASFYKKGTCHIKWKECAKPIIDTLNIYIGKREKWLPPTYGKKSYSNMDQEEKTIIDEFQGEEAYNEIMAHPEVYLYDTAGNSNMCLLPNNI